MSDPEDTWPEPNYNPGPTKHLHAVGVISSCYNSFEESVFELYQHHPRIQKLPVKLIHLYYRSINERERLAAVKAVFAEYEKDANVISLVENLVTYFEWCWDVRNKIIHAEQYPALFSSVKLSLSKRIGKKTSERGYMSLDLERIRGFADKIEFGKRHCARMVIYLRVRDVGLAHLSSAYRQYEHEPLPNKLDVPETLDLSPSPHPLQAPEYLLKPSRP